MVGWGFISYEISNKIETPVCISVSEFIVGYVYNIGGGGNRGDDRSVSA